MKGDAREVTEFRKIIRHRAQEYCPVTGRTGAAWILLKDNGPGGRAGAVPEGVGFRILRHEVAGFFTEVGDGTRFGKREWTTGILFFEIGHGFGEEWSEVTGLFEEDGLEGEAAGLVEEAYVACGELGSFGSRLINNGNADAMPVPDKGNF